MPKETETEEKIVCCGTFLSLVAFQVGGGGRAPLALLLATPMAKGYNILALPIRLHAKLPRK